MALIVVGMHIDQLPGIIVLIVNDAFTPMAGVGAAIGWGVKRGVYSNEAGQGPAHMPLPPAKSLTRHSRALCRRFRCMSTHCLFALQRLS